MALAKVSSRGQVTLPSSVRKQLEIEKGDELLIDVDQEKGTGSFRVIKKKRLSEFYGAFKAGGEWVGKTGEITAAGKYLSAHAERSLRKWRRK